MTEVFMFIGEFRFITYVAYMLTKESYAYIEGPKLYWINILLVIKYFTLQCFGTRLISTKLLSNVIFKEYLFFKHEP